MATSYPAFFGYWLYVSKVSRSGDILSIVFNERAVVEKVGSAIPIEVRLYNLETGQSRIDPYQWPDEVRIQLQYKGLRSYRWQITIVIDKVLAYSASVAP